MQFAANIFDVLLLVGAIQGFIIGLLLYRNRGGQQANRCLAWILFLLSLACLNLFMLETNIGFDTTWWEILTAVIPLIIIMPIGPLIYFYLRSLLQAKWAFTKSDRRHFYLVILDFIPALLSTAYIFGVIFQMIDPAQSTSWNRLIDHFDRYLDIPRWLSISYYLWRSWQLLLLEPNKLETPLKWPKQLLKGFALFQLIWLLHLIPYLLPQTSNLLLRTFSWYPVYIPMVVLVYWLGIKGFLVSLDFQRTKSSVPQNSLEEAIAKKIIRRLDYSMQEEKLFLNPKLKLKLLVEHTGLNQKQVSAALNQYLGKNFNEYLNGYRIQEAQKRLIADQSQHLTIAAIAYDCGFNSLTTFQRTFKAVTGQTPKFFQQENTRK